MILFGRELSLEQMIGLVECHATPDEDLVHRAALEIIAALRESQRRADAAVEDMESFGHNIHTCANRDECSRELVAYECCYNCPRWQWRGPQAEEGDSE